MLYVQIKNINSKNNIIELPVREADPEPINLEKIRKETENTSFLHCFLQNAQIFNG